MKKTLGNKITHFYERFANLQGMVSFGPNTPELFNLPDTDYVTGPDNYNYSFADNEKELKNLINKLFYPSISINPGNLSFTYGSQHAFSLIFSSLESKKQKVLLLERYNYSLLDGLLNFHHLEYKAMVQIGQTDKSTIEKYFSAKPDFFYIQPDNANPTGKSLTLAERKLIISLSRKYKVQIIEDLTYRFLNYKKNPLLPSLAEIEPNVISVGSLSKIYFPALRFGWIVGSKDLIKRIEMIKRTTLISVSPLINSVAHKYLHIYNEWLDNKISSYRQKMDLLQNLLKLYFPTVTYTIPQGGYMLWVKADDPQLRKKIGEIEKHKVIWHPGRLSDYLGHRDSEKFFKISVGNLTEETIETGMRRIGCYCNGIKMPLQTWKQHLLRKLRLFI